MTPLLPHGHPYWHSRLIAEQHINEIRRLYFSYYEYVPQTLADNRETFTLSAKEFLDVGRIEKILQATPIGKELAFHSMVESHFGERKHIPMVDMSTGSQAHLAKLKNFLGDALFQQFKWFRSGRSFHGYGGDLIAERDFMALMGTLLLANQKGLAPTVDPRWVGHRLIAGYAALRWTKNTSYYKNIPREID